MSSLGHLDGEGQQVRGQERLGLADLVEPAAPVELLGVGRALDQRHQALLRPFRRAWTREGRLEYQTCLPEPLTSPSPTGLDVEQVRQVG